MFVIGLSGGPDLVHENLFAFTPGMSHDSACVLLEDGEVVFGIEEERLNRIKHTNKFPVQALNLCLDSRGLRLQDVDMISYYSTREMLDLSTKELFLTNPDAPIFLDGASLFQHLLQRQLGVDIDPRKLRFVHHHHAHAMSALALSGFEESLVITIDGQGDRSSGMVFTGKGNRLEQLVDLPVAKSLGLFYVDVIAYLGYGLFDEYKVMGLAPYGDPEKHKSLFESFYTLLPGGDYEIHSDRIIKLFDLGTPRRKWEPLTQLHKDIAASLQAALEEIAFHIISYYRERTGLKNLCLAGGVAHNCTLNGKLLTSGMFENIFIQPASHDAGGALGSALYSYFMEKPEAQRPFEMEHLYWGSHIGSAQGILRQLTRWRHFLTYERADNITEQAAELLAKGNVLGWVQGCSEFGPRALGNRSILADPRPSENKDRINQMVKKREGYRPFAPSVLEEDVCEFFDVPSNLMQLAFMVYVVNVRENKRELLGAVTHVDGTARIQTVSRKTNTKFWNLIHAFKKLVGIPVLLNTSFNNNSEPIVDSVEDAIVCFLTTQIDYLVVGDYLIKKKDCSPQDYLALNVSLPPYISLHEVKRLGPNGQPSTSFSIRNSYNAGFQFAISAKTFRSLSRANGEVSLKQTLAGDGDWHEQETQESVQEFIELWSKRFIVLRPEG